MVSVPLQSIRLLINSPFRSVFWFPYSTLSASAVNCASRSSSPPLCTCTKLAPFRFVSCAMVILPRSVSFAPADTINSPVLSDCRMMRLPDAWATRTTSAEAGTVMVLSASMVGGSSRTIAPPASTAAFSAGQSATGTGSPSAPWARPGTPIVRNSAIQKNMIAALFLILSPPFLRLSRFIPFWMEQKKHQPACVQGGCYRTGLAGMAHVAHPLPYNLCLSVCLSV